ncbi:hypothetical protein DL768_008805 [Monosporascus sp. mg162]|nr:hypothetical protein DL768_008805 [Monosporascus sp. mg162]
MAEEWEHNKEVIHQLWIEENLSLNDVVARMETYGFKRRKPQYERKLKAWGFRKNLKKAERLDIARTTAKRRRDGKESEVLLDGTQLSSKRIKRALARIPLSSIYGQGFVLTSLNAPQQEGASSQATNSEDTIASSFYSRSKSTALSMLKKVAPETYDGEHDSTASMLLSNSVSEVESARLKVLLYQLSNNMQLALELREELTDAQVIAIVKRVAQKYPDWMRSLLSSEQPTVAAIKENLFAVAMRCLDVELADQLLVAGVNPNMPILRQLPEVKLSVPRGRRNEHICWCPNSYLCTPLQLAASVSEVGLVKVLIRAGAKADLILQERDLSPLELACGTATTIADSRVLDTVKELVANGAVIDRAADPSRPTALLLTVASGNADLVEFILGRGAEVNRQYRPPDTKSLTLNPFQVALLKADIRILDMLTRSHGTVVPRSRRFNAPVLAVCSQDPEKMLLYLRMLGVNVAMPSRQEENPLTTALFLEQFDLAHQLLDLNASPTPGRLLRSNPTRPAPIHAAACVGDIFMIDLLLRQGASVNDTLSCSESSDVESRVEIFTTYSKCRSSNWAALRSPLQITLEMGHVAAAMHLIDRESALLGGELVMATRLHDVDLVERLIRHGARYDDTWYGETAVQAAIRWGSRDLATTLIRAGCIITGNEYAQTLMNGYQELADIIATHTCSKTLIKPGFQGQTPLEAACLTGNTDIAKNLLSRDDVRYESGALCAASWNAVSTRRYGLVETLLRHREPSVIDEFEATALGIAARYEDIYLISLLLIDNVQLGPALALDSAAMDGSKGCWWRKTPAVRKSPLHIAVETGNYLIAKSIIARGFEPDEECFLHTLSLSTNGDDAEIARSIWTAKRPFDYGPACAGKAFETAIEARSIDSIRKLIAADLDVNSRTPKGWTPLQLSVQYGCMETIQVLTDAGAAVNAPPAQHAGATAAQVAAIMGYMGIMRVLRGLGADINAPAAKTWGRTALEGAAEYGRLDMVRLLLNEGVTTEGDGRKQFIRAILFAENEGRYAVAKMLRGYREWTDEDTAVLEVEEPLCSVARTKGNYCEEGR